MSTDDSKTNDKSVTITYLPTHGKSGRGLSIRLALILGDIRFEDVVITRPEHYKQKANGERRWGGLPEMDIYSKAGKSIKIAQSSTCLRYAGSISGLYPTGNSVKEALINEIIDSVEDLIQCGMIPLKHAKSADDRKKLFESLMSDTNGSDYGKMRYWFDKFELRLKENNEERANKNVYFVGSTLTIADLKVFAHLRNFVNGAFTKAFGIPDSIFVDNGYKRIAAFVDKLRNQPQIKQFIIDFDERLGNFHGAEDQKEKYRKQIYGNKIVFGEF